MIGFEKHLVVPGPDGTVAHAQLALGGGMLMLGSADNGSDYGTRIRQPDEIGGFETQSAYVVVADADAVLARAPGRRLDDRHPDQGRGLRRARLQLPRSRGAALERRHLRPVGLRPSDANGLVGALEVALEHADVHERRVGRVGPQLGRC